MFSTATQPPPPRRPPRHNFVVSAITFEGFRLRSSNFTHVVGLRILSIREMVFTLCLILILDPFFSTTTMPLADF